MSSDSGRIASDGLSLMDVIVQVDARLEELRPLVREFEQLVIARAALAAGAGELPRRTAARPRVSRAATRRGRRAPRGANRDAILVVVGRRAGITVAEIATLTGIARPTVHSTVYALRARGILATEGTGVRIPGANASTTSPTASSTGGTAGARRAGARPGRARGAGRTRSRRARTSAPARARTPTPARARARARTQTGTRPSVAPVAPGVQRGPRSRRPRAGARE